MFDHVLLNTFLLNPVGTLARIGRVIPRTIDTVFRSNAFFALMSLFATTAQTSERSLANTSPMTISLASEAAERIRDERPHCARQVANPDPFRQRWGLVWFLGFNGATTTEVIRRQEPDNRK